MKKLADSLNFGLNRTWKSNQRSTTNPNVDNERSAIVNQEIHAPGNVDGPADAIVKVDDRKFNNVDRHKTRSTTKVTMNMEIGDSNINNTGPIGSYNTIINNSGNTSSLKLDELRERDLEAVHCDIDAICLSKTRRSLLHSIKEWVADTDGKRILWLYGGAGSGKSTVANTIALYYVEEGHLGASFRFSHDTDGRNTPRLLFRNIAYQLARFDDTFKAHLLMAIEKCGTIAPPLRQQLRLFIIEPAKEISRDHPTLIVIDAVDECGDERVRSDVVKAIAAAAPTLPNSLKIMITSRKERDINTALAPVTFSLNIHEDEEIDNDIREYIDHRMGEIVNGHTYLPEDWPGASDKAMLTTRAGGLFMWVRVSSDYMESSADPQGVLMDLLSGQCGSAEEELDKLYLRILTRQIKHCSDDELKYLLGSIMVAKVPLTKRGLDLLLGLDANDSRHRNVSRIRLTTCASLIDALGPILLVSSTGTIRFLHASIADFLTDRLRSTDRFFINRPEHDHSLTIRCFKTLNMLCRDICKIKDPTKLNSKIVDLGERLRRCLPEHLRYACIYWSQHLEATPIEHDDVYDSAKRFFCTSTHKGEGNLLHWIEVMSLLNHTGHVELALGKMKSWFHSYPSCEADILQLTDEAVHLMRRFREPIQQSAAHVYVSAIPLTSPNSILYKNYAHTLENIPKLIYGNETSSLSGDVHLRNCAAALTPDRSRLVYARQEDCELWILDVATGIAITGPLVGHNHVVRKIKFSKDGNKFCSLDAANSVIVWDATIYRTIGVPLQLLSEAEDVAPFGSKVVVQHRESICVWDVATGELEKEHGVLNRFMGTTFHGAYYTTENDAYTRKFVKTMTGEDVTSKFDYGRGTGGSILFSPDDTRVIIKNARGCRLLDVDSGNIIGKPITHAGQGCPSFAADGKHLITRNQEGISILDATTGNLAAGPFKWPSGFFDQQPDLSLDGARLLAVGEEKSGVIDVRSGRTIITFGMKPSRNSTYFFSPDGTRVIRVIQEERVMGHTPKHEGFSVSLFNVTSLSSNHDVPLKSVAPSPTGPQFLFLLSDNTLRLVVDILSTPVALLGAISPATFSPDGSIVISAYPDHTLRLWHSKDASPFGKPLVGHTKAITAVAFSPTGSNKVISASRDATIRIWNASSKGEGEELVQIRAYFDTWSISLSLDESRIISVSELGVVQLLDARTGSAISQPWKDNWRWAEFSLDGREITCISVKGQTCSIDSRTSRITGHRSGIIIDDPAMNSEITEGIFSPTKTHFLCTSKAGIIEFSDKYTQPGDTYDRFTFSSDDRWMMSVHEMNRIFWISMWETESGRRIWESPIAWSNFPSMAISHSGKKAVIWSIDCQVRDTSSGAIISCWSPPLQPLSVAFSPDESQIIMNMLQTCETWDIESGTRISAEDSIWNKDSELNLADRSDRRRHPLARKRWTLTLHDIVSSNSR